MQYSTPTAYKIDSVHKRSILWLCVKKLGVQRTIFTQTYLHKYEYNKTCVKWPLLKDKKMFFKTDYHLMQVKSIAECSQYFRPELSCQLSLSIFFLSGRFTQVLLYYG